MPLACVKNTVQVNLKCFETLTTSDFMLYSNPAGFRAVYVKTRLHQQQTECLTFCNS